MDRKLINAGFEAYGQHWGNKIWLVREMDRKKEGRKDFYCVLGLGSGGWWHLFYGTLSQARDYIEYELGERKFDEVRK